VAQLPPTLKKGSKGEAVKGLQNALNERASLGVAVDGNFGPATENAVKGFQQAASLAVDGIAGPATWGALYVYVVQRGDSLSKIAQQNFGDSNQSTDIYNLNQALISDPDKITPGQVLTLPIYE
jgi:peptidoglycan hydrolase-like protein with peptidoglycan-binding domain